jgi:hypothetical protein
MRRSHVAPKQMLAQAGSLYLAGASLDFLNLNVVLLVCPDCGLAKAEPPDNARRKLQLRISALEQMLRELKSLSAATVRK